MYIFKAFHKLGTKSPLHVACTQPKPSNSPHSGGSCPPGLLCLWLLEAFSLPKIQSPRTNHQPTQTWQKTQISWILCPYTSHISPDTKLSPSCFPLKYPVRPSIHEFNRLFWRLEDTRRNPLMKQLVFYHLYDPLLPIAPISRFFSLITQRNSTLPKLLPSNLHS